MYKQNSRNAKRPRTNEKHKHHDTESDDDSQYDDDSEVDEHGNLRGFIEYTKDELNKRRKLEHGEHEEETLNLNEKVKSDHLKRYNDTLELIKKSVPTLDEIMELNNIIDDEREDLLIKYSVMKQLVDTPEEYYKYANYLKEIINDFRNSKQTIDEKNQMNNAKIELKKLTTNMCSLEKEILTSDMPQYHKTVIYHKYTKLRLMSPQDSEYYKLKEWIDFCISYFIT